MAVDAGENWEDTFPLRSKEGEYNWFLSRAVPIRNDKGDILHWFGTNTDITQLRSTEEKLKEAKEKAEENDKLKSAFLANMSHEIRTPMTGILGFTELLKTTEINEDQKVYLNIVESNGKRMLQIINDLIDISKIEAHQVELNYEATDLPQLLNELLVFFVPEANKKNIFLKLNCDLPFGLEKTYTDQTRVSQILNNLIKNALKFTSKGTVEFGCEPLDNSYKFYVKDTGPGIPPEKTGIIFERFRQGDISWADKYDGVGLGLSISKAYVELLGGNLYVKSEVGSGSEFFFTLPYQSVPLREVPVYEPQLLNIKPVHNKKVLIAEDEDGIYMLLSTILRSQKIETIHACDGQEAIEILKNRHDIDLVLMDSKMPNLSGSEATRIIRSFNTKVPIIALSAYSSEADKIKAINTGCNDYLVKPMTREGFMEKVMKYL
jgi:signal transduction histidine kinase/CheY-like chemotaxis protein